MRRSCGRSAAEAGALPCSPPIKGRIKGRVAAAVLLAVLAAAAAAWGGHEVPVYLSYYPHEIHIGTVAPEAALDQLRDGKIQAYLGRVPRFSGALPDSIGAVESLGSFVMVEVNPASPLAGDEPSACALAAAVLGDIAGHGDDFVFHPYPVTPFHGDYLYHADLAAAAAARVLGQIKDAVAQPTRRLKVKATGDLATRMVRAGWQTQDPDWDAAVYEVDAAGLVAASTTVVNGWFGPPWLKSGWFQAHLLLAGSPGEPNEERRAEADVRRLEAGDYDGNVERINLEREFVGLAASGCRKRVAGYTVKRQYFSAEYSAGIENVAYDSIAGLDSPMFIRTAKLKDFPWNGWLALGIDVQSMAAWNPMAGFTDRFGRMVWFALGDPAVLPAPDDAGWTINRISDVQSRPSP